MLNKVLRNHEKNPPEKRTKEYMKALTVLVVHFKKSKDDRKGFILPFAYYQLGSRFFLGLSRN
jgi:hypothetical protein